jgi:hypothetical protein
MVTETLEAASHWFRHEFLTGLKILLSRSVSERFSILILGPGGLFPEQVRPVALDITKPLVDEAIGQDPYAPRVGAFLPYRAAASPPDIGLHRPAHPSPSPMDRLWWYKLNPAGRPCWCWPTCTGARCPPGSASAPRRLEIGSRDRDAVGRPDPEPHQALRDAARAGLTCLVIDRHLNPHRPGRRRPALLFRQASQSTGRTAGHRQPRDEIA